MKTVNPLCVTTTLITPLVGLADAEELFEEYEGMNPDSEKEVKQMILEVLQPHFDSLSPVIKNKCKLALSYYLTTSMIDFEKIFDSEMLPFDPPSPPKLFFIWLWEVLFEGEDYVMKNPEQFIEKGDNSVIPRDSSPNPYSIYKAFWEKSEKLRGSSW